MANEKKHAIKLTENNKHLLDVFSNDFYLELGITSDEALNMLLHKKLVSYKDLCYFDIIKKGLGSMECASNELTEKLPFMYFNNIVNKNKAFQLVLTYGLLRQRKGYKETFAPIILVPVKMYFENDDILFQMIGNPFINPLLAREKNEKRFEFSGQEKIDNISAFDGMIFSFVKNQVQNVRLENYLTVISTKKQEVQLHHEIFKLDNNLGSKLTEKYAVNGEGDTYTITPLDRTQRTAVAMASSGNSFAITGYEGTGKTTTLVNIAADAIKKGKRVLYVSNNDNTLKKVYDIFKANELDSFVSKLNQSFTKVNERNHDIKKGQIIDSVVKTELQDKYKEIEEYEKLLSKKVQNHPVLNIMSELVLTPTPTQLFSDDIMNNAYKLYKHEINEVFNSLEIIEEKMRKLETFKNSHFIEIPITHMIKSVDEPMQLIEKLFDNYCILYEEKLILEKKYGFKDIKDHAYFKSQINNYFKFNKENTPTSWYQLINEDQDMYKAFANFSKAKKVFEFLRNETNETKLLKQKLNERYNLDVLDFDVNQSVKEILGSIFNIEDENRINSVLLNYKLLKSEIEKAQKSCNDLENDFSKLKEKLRLEIGLENSNVLEEIINFINVLDKGYFSKVWCDFDKSDEIFEKMSSIETILDGYQQSSEIYYKYFDNIYNLDANIALLERKRKDEKSKYRGIIIDTLLPHLYYLRKHNIKVSQMKKEYKDITYSEYKYKTSISKIYQDFVNKYNLISDSNAKRSIERSMKDMRGSDLVDVLTIAKSYKKSIMDVFILYDIFTQYNLVPEASSVVDKVNNIRGIVPYIYNIVNNQTKMAKLLKNEEKLCFETYLSLSNWLKSLDEIVNKINENREYVFLFEKLFNGEKTDILYLEKCINNFDDYINVFEKPIDLVHSLDDSVNNSILVYLKNSDQRNLEINELFKDYVKLFKTNISKYYYEDFKKVIQRFKELLDSEEELRLYLSITDQMKVLLKYKLTDLNNYIIENEKENITDKFRYSYFKKLFDDFVSKNKNFVNVNQYEKILDSIMFLEKDLIESNREILKISIGKNYHVGRARHLDYNQYILKNRGSKMLYLTDTIIVNSFIDMDLFDLVIIDDGQLLHANEYYKVVSCPQVIIGGTEKLQTSITNTLLLRIRKNSIIQLKYRYATTPLTILKKNPLLRGRFYSDVSLNKGIEVTKENFNSLILKLYKNDLDCKINFFTSSYERSHNIFQNIGNILYDRGMSVEEINSFFDNTLSVNDLTVGCTLDADYNILDISTYSDIDDEFLCVNMIDTLLTCNKKLIILDPKGVLNKSNPKKFVEMVKEIIQDQETEFYLERNSVLEKLSRVLSRYRIKTVGTYLPLHLVVEYDENYFGIMLFENPETSEFAILNEYREFKSTNFPVTIVWLSDLATNFNKTVQQIIKEIRS